MSEFPPLTLKKWRDEGSLHYLAHHLSVTTKQVTRYWDNGWIEGAYRTPGGHRRIGYTDETVKRVSLAVSAAKTTNTAIRYRISEIDYCGTVIPVKGCTKMQDVYRRARKAGLSKWDARNAAYQPRGLCAAPFDPHLDWEYLLAQKGTSQTEVAESTRTFARLRPGYLLQARDTKDFRARAREVWRDILSELKASVGWDGFPRLSPEGKARRREIREKLSPLLRQPDIESFISAFNKATELDTRIMEHDEQTYRKVQEAAGEKPEMMRLQIAVLSLRRAEQSPSAAALARCLRISRPALYRKYGAREIQTVLNSVRDDPWATHATRTDRKKSNPLAAKRDE